MKWASKEEYADYLFDLVIGEDVETLRRDLWPWVFQDDKPYEQPEPWRYVWNCGDRQDILLEACRIPNVPAFVIQRLLDSNVDVYRTVEHNRGGFLTTLAPQVAAKNSNNEALQVLIDSGHWSGRNGHPVEYANAAIQAWNAGNVEGVKLLMSQPHVPNRMRIYAMIRESKSEEMKNVLREFINPALRP